MYSTQLSYSENAYSPTWDFCFRQKVMNIFRFWLSLMYKWVLQRILAPQLQLGFTGKNRNLSSISHCLELKFQPLLVKRSYSQDIACSLLKYLEILYFDQINFRHDFMTESYVGTILSIICGEIRKKNKNKKWPMLVVAVQLISWLF